MPLCFVQVSRRFPEEGVLLQSCGHFVIESPYSRQDEVLSLLSNDEKKEIAYMVGAIDQVWDNLSNVDFTLSVRNADQSEISSKPTFKTQGGYDVWVVRDQS